jgi:hypothetical protein
MFRLWRLVLLGAALALILSLSPRQAEAINCTFRICPVSNQCPGTFINNVFCCRPGTDVVCFYTYDAATGCVRSVSGFCV